MSSPGFQLPDDQSRTLPSSDVQQTPMPTGGEVPPATPPGWHPEAEVPPRSIRHVPRWPHPNFGWSFLWCIFFLLLTEIPGGIIALIIAVVLIAIAPDQYRTLQDSPKDLMKSPALNLATAIGLFIAKSLGILFSLLVIRLVVGRDWARQLAVRKPSVSHTLLALASFPSLVLLGNAAYAILRDVLHFPSLADLGMPGMEEAVKMFSTWPWAFAVLVIGVGPGIGEELWCRGFLGRGLVGNYGIVLGVLATSFFFGLIHLDPCQGTMAMIMGFWLHFVYLTTRSLWLPMLLHFLNNSLAVLVTRAPSLEVIEAEPGDIPVYVYLAALLLLAGAAYALYQSRARLRSQSPDQLYLWRPAYEGVEYPPPHVGMYVAHPRPSLAASAAAAGGFVLFVLACLAWVMRS